jgi:hypothetical protein
MNADSKINQAINFIDSKFDMTEFQNEDVDILELYE